MEKKPVLVVMAAGMGSRYGGLKQMDAVGNCGEAILDFSIYDAHTAGFETVVLIIKEEIREDFIELVGKRLEKAPVEIRYAYQELDRLPEGYFVPAGRSKPWGTAHAVLCAKEAVDGAPFAVINADDYYGKRAFHIIYDALLHAEENTEYDHCMVGYELANTVTEHGSVARGVCRVDENGFLMEVAERTRIEKHEGGIHFTEDGEHWTELPLDTTVSMNMWGFTSSCMEAVEAGFAAFLDKAIATNPMKGEYFLPSVVTQMLSAGNTKVKVFTTPDRWYGVTYAADKPIIVAALKELAARGVYPYSLWGTHEKTDEKDNDARPGI